MDLPKGEYNGETAASQKETDYSCALPSMHSTSPLQSEEDHDDCRYEENRTNSIQLCELLANRNIVGFAWRRVKEDGQEANCNCPNW